MTMMVVGEADRKYWERLRSEGRLPKGVTFNGQYLITKPRENSNFFGLYGDYDE